MESDREYSTSRNNGYVNKDYPRSIDKKKILKPIRQEKIVKVPVTEYIEKIVEQEEIKYVNKYVDVIKPIITYKTKHVPKPIYLDKIRYETKVIEKEKIIHIPKIQYKNKIVEVPVYVHREKIIEKKIPLIIERVVPVLKTKKLEKDVYIDSVGIPEICEMKHRERRASTFHKGTVHQRENSLRKNSVQLNESVSSFIKTHDEDTSNMKTYRLNEEIETHEVPSNSQGIMEQNYKYKGDIRSESSNANSEADSRQGEPIVHKNETTFHESVMREPVHESYIDNNSQSRYNNNNEKREEPNYLEQRNSIYVRANEEYNMPTGASIHLPEYETEGVEYSEQRSMNDYNQNYQVTVNNAHFNEMVDKRNMYLGNHMNNHDKCVSEQVLRNENIVDPKLHYSFPLRDEYQENYQNNKDQNEMEQLYNNNNNNTQINVNLNGENNTMQNIQMSEYGKQSMRPSYANSNGQALISVRPATIVEYKPKPRKLKNPMCNFLNNCCRG